MGGAVTATEERGALAPGVRVSVMEPGGDASANYALLPEPYIAPALCKKELSRGGPRYGVYTDDGVPNGSGGAPLKYGGGDADTGCYAYRLSGDCVSNGGDCLRRKLRSSVKGYQAVAPGEACGAGASRRGGAPAFWRFPGAFGMPET